MHHEAMLVLILKGWKGTEVPDTFVYLFVAHLVAPAKLRPRRKKRITPAGKSRGQAGQSSMPNAAA